MAEPSEGTLTPEGHVEAALREIFGEQLVYGQHMFHTASRVANYWRSLRPVLDSFLDAEFTMFDNEPRAKQMVVCSNIPFHSACAHHLLPFEGRIHVGYLPNENLAGLSKFPRAVRHFAQRPQTQELLVRQLADYLYSRLEPHGLGVRCVAVHTCTTCRGVEASGTLMVTDAMLGDFQRYETVKQEFLDMCREALR